jgi:hypothetical protein
MLNRNSLVAIKNPTIKEAAEVIKGALSERKGIVLIGNCWVDYQGRASSKLDPGERIVIIKKDGSVLVHRPTGYEPVNWQPPGSLFKTSVIEEILGIRSIRRKPSESVQIFFNRIYLLSTLNLIDRGEFFLHASEAEMQKAILLKPSIIEHGFKPITYEKKVEPGFVDVYGTDKNGKFVVIEIKRKTAGREAALQLAKYVKAIKVIVNREVRGILVAPRMAKGVQKLLTTLKLEYKSLDPRQCVEILDKSTTKKISDFLQLE